MTLTEDQIKGAGLAVATGIFFARSCIRDLLELWGDAISLRKEQQSRWVELEVSKKKKEKELKEYE